MNVLLLPRLTSLGVASLLEEESLGQSDPVERRRKLTDRPALISYAASGGHRADTFPDELGKGIRQVAERTGFPDNTSQVARSKFDHECSIYLASVQELATGEGLRDDVWSYITTVVVPDIVCWRFPDRGHHRFEGGVRNALQRLWIRGVTLDRGGAHPDRWGLVRALSEDAAVQIFERASISGNRDFAVSLAEGWTRVATRLGRNAMEPIMRSATKLLRLRNELIDISSLAERDREELISEAFELAAKASAPPNRPLS